MSPALSAPQSPLVPQQQLLSDDWKQEISERLDPYRAHRPQTAAKPSSPPRNPLSILEQQKSLARWHLDMHPRPPTVN